MMLIPYRLRYRYFMPVHGLMAVCALMAVAFIVQCAAHVDFNRWGLMRGAVEPERLVTHAFIHAGPLHFGSNLVFLLVFGQVVNAAVGSGVFAAVTVLCLATSTTLELAVDERLYEIPAIGLSGAITGLMIISCLWLRRIKVQFVVWFVFMLGTTEFSLISVAATSVFVDLFLAVFGEMFHSRIAVWGHLGGAAGGVAAWGIMRYFRTAQLTGFSIEEAATAAAKRVWLRVRRVADASPAPTPEDERKAATCLRCGYRFRLKGAPEEGKPLRCFLCGQASKEHGGPAPDLPARRRKSLIAIIALAAAVLAADYLLMRHFSKPLDHVPDSPDFEQRGE